MSAPGRAVHGEGRCGLAHCPARVCVCVIRAPDGMTDEGGAPEFVSCPALFAFCEIERGIAGTGLFDDGLKGKGRAGRGGSWRGRCGLAHCPALFVCTQAGRERWRDADFAESGVWRCVRILYAAPCGFARLTAGCGRRFSLRGQDAKIDKAKRCHACKKIILITLNLMKCNAVYCYRSQSMTGGDGR